VTTSLSDLARDWSAIRKVLSAPAEVLIVEDEQGIRELFQTILTRADYICTVCATAEAALERFALGCFDVVVTDKNLPGMDGLDLIAAVRKQDSDCEAVVVTGYPNLDSVVRAIDMQHVEYLTKPLDSLETLVSTVARAHLRRTRRVLAKHMVTHLQDVLKEHAGPEVTAGIKEARERAFAFRDSLTNKRTLVCWRGEDSQVRGILGTLAESGYALMAAENGMAVLSQCERHHVSVLIVSDSFGDMDAEHLVEKVLEFQGHPELVYVTSCASFDHAVAATRRGAAGFFVKPIRDQRPLQLAVRRACELQHERMVHFKLVAELSQILMAIDARNAPDEGREILQSTLSKFDVRSAKHALQRVEGGTDTRAVKEH